MPDHRTWGWHGLCFRAMNTGIEVQLYTDRHVHAPQEVQRMFHTAESCLTRFDPSSELCQLNRSAGGCQRVSSLLYDVVEAAMWAARATQGLFDPTMLRTMESIGYDRSFELVQREQPAGGTPRTPPRGRYAAIGLKRARREICLPPDVQLDLGGIGKGWTVDRASDWLAGLGPFLINAGGDLYAYGAPPGQPGWSIGIADPWEPTRNIARLWVRQQAVATSTTTRRQWRRGGRAMHHLIDPRTGLPADTDAVSATVIAPRAALAEVYAKTALIQGVEAGQRWLDSIPDVEGLLIRNNGQLIATHGLSAYLEVKDDHTVEA